MKFHSNRITRNVSKMGATEMSGDRGEDTLSGSNFRQIQTLIKNSIIHIFRRGKRHCILWRGRNLEM